MTQRPKFSIGYYLTIFLLILFLESMFFSGPAVKELPYSKFRDLIQKDKLEKMAQVLLEKEKMDDGDIIAILGPRNSKENQPKT